MIKINKDKHFPDVPGVRYQQANHRYFKQLKWRVLERKCIRQYLNDPTTLNDGTYVFSSDFGYQEFRDALAKCQGPKCAYCEKPVAGGAIEHFRPKKAWQQTRGGAFTRPGYYWLAFRWENMLISCSECNQSGRKGNFFPVNGYRALNHTMDYKLEQNEIINPAEEDPSQFISFIGVTPIGIDAQGRGQLNVNLFELRDRADLLEIRRDRFLTYKHLKKIAAKSTPDTESSPQDIKDARIYIGRAQKSKAPFAGMIRENIKRGIL